MVYLGGLVLSSLISHSSVATTPSSFHFKVLLFCFYCHHQVALVTAQFRRAKEHFDPPGLQFYEPLLSIFNQSYDLDTEPAELHVICEKLQYKNVEDIKKEYLALHKMVADRGCHLEKSTKRMSILLKKIEDFMRTESANFNVSLSEDSPPHTDELYMKLCSQSLFIPDEFRCPISLELMKDPVIICTGQVRTWKELLIFLFYNLFFKSSLTVVKAKFLWLINIFSFLVCKNQNQMCCFTNTFTRFVCHIFFSLSTVLCSYLAL